MKAITLILLLASAASAQDLGGVGETISKLSLAARGGTAVDLNKHVTGVLYLPYPALHSADGTVEYAVLGLGADLGSGASGTALRGAPLLLPMVNLVGLLGRAFKRPWASSHITFSDVGSNLDLGIGVKPLPITGSRGKFVIGNQIEGVLTFGFGKK